jgi:flavin reductase (DIM6/NTAB) family NADH-FMN oxidoreductase RutF
VRKEIEWNRKLDLVWGALSSGGALLVVLDEKGKPNLMTIGWGELGIVWSRPVCTVLVRPTRYTYGGIRTGDSFTVNVPRHGELEEALALCGSKSGRALDKAKACGLTWEPSKKVKAPIIAECALFFECEILSRAQLSRESFRSADVLATFYPKGDPHLVVFGEIVASYAEDDL